MGLFGCGSIFRDIAYMGEASHHQHDSIMTQESRMTDQELRDELARRNQNLALQDEIAALRQEIADMKQAKNDNWSNF